jgi:uncharacterized protein YaaW (UPF0174 family)
MEPDINSFTLSVEQQFQMKLIENSIENLSDEEMRVILTELLQLLIIKDNAIKDLLANDENFLGFKRAKS